MKTDRDSDSCRAALRRQRPWGCLDEGPRVTEMPSLSSLSSSSVLSK